MNTHKIVIIGGGPAGLAAAEVLSEAGHAVTVCDAMPSVGRKLLLAGKSGLNLTHAEAFDRFVERYGAQSGTLLPSIRAFTPDMLRAWADDLGVETFVGSSGRVFPKRMKASPLLRAWLARLESRGVTILTRHRWIGLDDVGSVFLTPEGEKRLHHDAVLMAMGGASWPRLGSDGAWAPVLSAMGIEVSPLRPANCGFDVTWSEGFHERFAGAPVKSVVASSEAGSTQGEFVITASGIEGSLVYAHAAALRDRLDADGRAALVLDLVPGRSLERLTADLSRVDPKASFSTRLRKGARLDGVKAALVRDLVGAEARGDPARLAAAIKSLAIPLDRARPIAEAISTAGGIDMAELDENLMLRRRPGLFAAGEMLDWEAPTGGYLLTACFATGRAAGAGMIRWLDGNDRAD